MQEVYTFGEALKMLGVTSNEFNDLIANKKIVPVRHEGRLKFKKQDIDRILNPQAHSQEPVEKEKFYNWDEALTMLQIEDEDLRNLVEDGDIPIASGMKFHCADIDKWIDIKCSDATIVVPVAGSSRAGSSGSAPIPPRKKPRIRYSRNEVMNVLQLEDEDLDLLLNEGLLTVYYEQGEMKFDKEIVDAYRNQRQVDATIVMPCGSHNFPTEDDDDLVTLEAPTPSSSPVIVTEEESGSEIEPTATIIDPDESCDIIEESDLAEESSDGGNVLSTLILPEEEKGSSSLSQVKNANDPSFYSHGEAAKYLKTSEEELKKILDKKKIRKYIMGGVEQIKRLDLLSIYSAEAQNREELLNTPPSFSKENSSKKYYGLEKVKSLLQITEQKIKIMVAKGELKAIREQGKFQFLAEQVDSMIRHNSDLDPEEVDATMVLPLPDFDEEDADDLAILEKPSSPTRQPSVSNLDSYFRFSEVLNILQMENEQLEQLVERGELSCILAQGEKRLPKAEVEAYKIEKMVEPTIMVGDNDGGDDILEENDDDIFFLS